MKYCPILSVSVSFQAQSSPLKTLLEIIVKHHISGPHHSKVSSESSVGLSSFPSPQVAPAVLKRTKPRDETADVFTNSQTNLRYFKITFLVHIVHCCCSHVDFLFLFSTGLMWKTSVFSLSKCIPHQCLKLTAFPEITKLI